VEGRLFRSETANNNDNIPIVAKTRSMQQTCVIQAGPSGRRRRRRRKEEEREERKEE
jgi:hypothetical protein